MRGSCSFNALHTEPPHRNLQLGFLFESGKHLKGTLSQAASHACRVAPCQWKKARAQQQLTRPLASSISSRTPGRVRHLGPQQEGEAESGFSKGGSWTGLWRGGWR